MRPLLPALMLLAAVPAFAQAPAELASRLPAEAAGWSRRGVTDLETRPGGAGLGAAAEYRPASGPGVATIYLYRRGTTVEAELAQAQEDIRSLGAMRQYTVGAPREWGSLLTGSRCVVAEQRFTGGQAADTYACVGQSAGWTVKLRVTLPAGAEAAPTLQALSRAAYSVL
ncbi:hypothetical protein [Sabulicella glaciei]|uniref:Uncharacterized protein n=1 Tax=Sabulicella glaciei TaxID=2984948 RepID=A0ABT3NXT0_9PROT|nr:hypothetical protein [Roseococcus sp. MDT2-1-1]MCW8086976.1 hypothetical protein [Roseococcus sp. MDT2-1-1]